MMSEQLHYNLLKFAGLIAAGFILSGCSVGSGSSVREALGLDKRPPDEFAVVTKAPLVVPPNYDLRPPREGAEPLQSIDPRLAARQSTFGGELRKKERASSRGETAILNKIGTSQADPDIRTTLNKESAALAKKDKKLTSKILFWQKKPKPGVVIDPKAEATRLKTARKQGKSVTAGATPLINCGEDINANNNVKCRK